MTHIQFQQSDDLQSLRLPELQQRYREVVGEETRCPNKGSLIRRIREALAGQESVPQEDPVARDEAPVSAETPPRSELTKADKRSREPAAPTKRGRFKSMTVEELRGLYLKTVGRQSGSVNRAYLAWKVREAEKGRIPIGPREGRSPEQCGCTEVRILPLRLEAKAVEEMDAAWKTRGIKSRTEFFRRAVEHYLQHLEAAEAVSAARGRED